MKLRIVEYLTDIEEVEGVALSANLCCSCGGRRFYFSYKGKQTKGILAPYLVKKGGQLVVKAICSRCKNAFVMYDSGLDGRHAKPWKTDMKYADFALPTNRSDSYEVVVKYNYYPEKFKEDGVYSNAFEDCFAYLTDKNGKEKALFEE